VTDTNDLDIWPSPPFSCSGGDSQAKQGLDSGRYTWPKQKLQVQTFRKDLFQYLSFSSNWLNAYLVRDLRNQLVSR